MTRNKAFIQVEHRRALEDINATINERIQNLQRIGTSKQLDDDDRAELERTLSNLVRIQGGLWL